jgi:hypothetical protein
MFTEYAFEPAHPCASVAVIVNEYVPVVVGVPPSDPAGLSVIPGGSVPAVTANVYGELPPLAVTGSL